MYTYIYICIYIHIYICIVYTQIYTYIHIHIIQQVPLERIVVGGFSMGAAQVQRAKEPLHELHKRSVQYSTIMDPNSRALQYSPVKWFLTEPP